MFFHQNFAPKSFFLHSKSQNFVLGNHASIKSLVEVLRQLYAWITEIPPVEQPMRFGNKAFRKWHTRLVESSEKFCRDLLAARNLNTDWSKELVPYFIDSFGNPDRVDYGTGHEATFLGFLYVLTSLGYFNDCGAATTNDANIVAAGMVPEIVTEVFAAYFELVSKLHSVYVMEPAGSHGVWGLDDYV